MRIWVSVLCALGALGCVDYGALMQEQLSDLRRRAAFEFECPEADLELTPLDSPYEFEGQEFHTQYGVTGCGRRAVYIDSVAGSYGANWVLNSDASSGAEAVGARPEPAQPPAEAPAGQDESTQE